MEEKDEWVFFKDIDWNCPKNNRFNIDTRDFHSGYNFNENLHKDWSVISKYPRFFFTEEELKSELERLYTESGGKGKWRMLDLVANDKRTSNWMLKYLRIWRTEKGFLVCNSENIAIPKDVLNNKVCQKYLGHH
jgi:hypothetical protein